MKNRYTVQEIDQTVTWKGEDHDVEYDEGRVVPSDISDALSALLNGCWDNVDIRESKVICYPADGSINYRTGAETRTQVVIKAEKPRYLEHLLNFYDRKGGKVR